MLTIRPIRPTDNQKLAIIIRQCFHDFSAPTCGTVYEDPATDDLFSLFRREKSVLWVAQWDDDVVGCCGIYPSDNLPEGCVELVKLYMTATARGKGTGKALMQKSMESAKEFGYSSIYIESLPEFHIAVSLYEKIRFCQAKSKFRSHRAFGL
ncbi:MAG: GNAT family N-acetyltransferase [Paludibacteraceae bacterium]